MPIILNTDYTCKLSSTRKLGKTIDACVYRDYHMPACYYKVSKVLNKKVNYEVQIFTKFKSFEILVES